jgi:hypothetical protein
VVELPLNRYRFSGLREIAAVAVDYRTVMNASAEVQAEAWRPQKYPAKSDLLATPLRRRRRAAVGYSVNALLAANEDSVLKFPDS